MKRYIEYEELLSAFFMAYFLYGKIKYGTKGYSEERLGSMTAYKSVMQLYRPFLLQKERVLSDLVMQHFDHLQDQAEALPDDEFKRVFLATLAQADPRRRLQES